MLAVTIDLALAFAAMLTALTVWTHRKKIQPSTVWQKLMTGASLLSFALVARLSDVFWYSVPWLGNDPLVREAVVMIGMAGGVLATAAGVAEWVPYWLELAARSRWRSRWAQAQDSLDRVVWQAESAAQIIGGLLDTLAAVCETDKVYYSARAQRTGQFVTPRSRSFTADEQVALQKISSHPTGLLMRTMSGWLLALPVRMDRRLYGVVLVHRDAGHFCLSESPLLEQTASLAALAMGTLIARAKVLRQAQWLATESALASKLGSTPDATSDLMGMLDVLRQKLGVDYASVLVYEGEGEYARRYSRLWDAHGLSERGIQVSIGMPPAYPSASRQALRAGRASLPQAALPHSDMMHHATVYLERGNQVLGLLVVASRTRPLTHSARYQLHRSASTFASAIERMALRHELHQMSRRLSGLGRLAGFGAMDSGHDYLVTRMLDEIPGTFCQFMRLSGSELKVEYRRSRRGGFGIDTTSQRFALESLPTCLMVVEAGRSVVFRQDDPERQFDTPEAVKLFGAEPHSILMVPVTHDGVCTALLAVGEMRGPRRHTFTVADRRYADSFSRLASHAGHASRSHLNHLGDLNLSFSSPLTGILGSVEILRQQIPGAGVHGKYLDVIEKNASRIRAKVGELADLASHE